MEPTKSRERIVEVDILRGFAVLGMVIWNFSSMSMGNYHIKGDIDRMVCGTIATLDVSDTVYPIFSFLFGWGLAMQVIRCRSLGEPFVSSYLRRLLVLLFIGIVHSLFWYRYDFIHIYAIYGAFLLAFDKLPNKALLVAAVIMIAAPLWGYILVGTFVKPVAYYGHGHSIPGELEFFVTPHYLDALSAHVYYFMREHAHPDAYIRGLDIIGLFLLGLYAARRGVLQDMARNIGLARNVAFCSLTVALVGLLWDSALRQLGRVTALGPAWVSPLYHFMSRWSLQVLAKIYFHHALSLFYICLVILLLQRDTVRKYFRLLANVGRLALSNYLLHSLIGTTIFYGYGLALYGTLGCASGEVLALSVFVFLALLSSWWLKRYQYGPVEWVLRSLAYGKFQRMKLVHD